MLSMVPGVGMGQKRSHWIGKKKKTPLLCSCLLISSNASTCTGLSNLKIKYLTIGVSWQDLYAVSVFFSS